MTSTLFGAIPKTQPNAGPDQTVEEGDVVPLDGSSSKDQDSGDSIKYLWKQTGGPVVKLNDADTPIATFTAPVNISSDKILTFKLTVVDNKSATNNDSVKITDKRIPQPIKLPELPSITKNTPGLSQSPSTCEQQNFPEIGQIGNPPSSEHGLRIRVDITGSEDGSHPAQITIAGQTGDTLCRNFDLTPAGQSILFYFYPGVINDREQFDACVTLLDTNSIKCVTGVNHLGRHSESVTLKAPNVRNP